MPDLQRNPSAQGFNPALRPSSDPSVAPPHLNRVADRGRSPALKFNVLAVCRVLPSLGPQALCHRHGCFRTNATRSWRQSPLTRCNPRVGRSRAMSTSSSPTVRLPMLSSTNVTPVPPQFYSLSIQRLGRAFPIRCEPTEGHPSAAAWQPEKRARSSTAPRSGLDLPE